MPSPRLVDEGDEVIIPTPYWVTYNPNWLRSPGKSGGIKTTPEQHFKISAELNVPAASAADKVLLLLFALQSRRRVQERGTGIAEKPCLQNAPGITILSDNM
ncbi:MAG: hypothetical protein U0U70_05795 [Chitinophagaceae bacterium]